MSETRLVHRIFIEAPPEIVWSAIADLEAVREYNPGISGASLTPGPREGVGAGRRCTTKQGDLVERVIGWDLPRAIEMQLVSSPWPVKAMRWRTVLAPKGGGTDVSQELSYAPSLGLVGMVLDMLMMRRTLDKAIAGVFASLKAYCEKKAKADG